MTNIKKVKELLKDTGLEDYEVDGETADEVIENLEDRISEDEVIYHYNAMKYLSENDPSLQNSIGIAVDMGYELKGINSELLATLLTQENLREELSKLRSQIEDIFDNAI